MLVRARLAFEARSGVTMQMTVRSESVEISELITTAIG